MWTTHKLNICGLPASLRYACEQVLLPLHRCNRPSQPMLFNIVNKHLILELRRKDVIILMFYFFVLCQFIPPTKDGWVFLAIHYEVSVYCFRTFIDVLRCGRLARSTCSLLRSLSLCLCRRFVSGRVHSIRFHGFRYVRRRFSRSFVTQHPRAAVLDC